MTISVWILKIFREPSPLYKKTYVSFASWILISLLIRLSMFSPDKYPSDYSNSNFKVLGLNIPTNLQFAGERVPQNDYEIKESLEKEFFANKTWKHSSLALFVKAQKWFPLIEPILKKEGVPDDFKYVAIIESHLSNAVSPMGAAGFWQLMPVTAQHYGLIVNSEVDERLDVEKATHVACKHFKDAYNYFHNWTLSAAAYNVGIGGIQNALKKQNTNNYYDLLLNKETGSFIYRILAFKTLLSNPEHFGVKNKIRKSGGFPAFKIVKVDSSVTNLTSFAKHIGTNVVTLKTFNPWLIGEQLNNPDKHVFQFKIPKNKNIDLSAYFNDVFPQEMSTDTVPSKPLTPDSIESTIDTIKKP
ncbi:MAG: murein transglycosylase [Bacteroidetes bacterium]|nr:murein transglycosylase [Bacteroidota bacterium]MDF2451160.1 murein transglycosylase [Bacteroidota bacterium]